MLNFKYFCKIADEGKCCQIVLLQRPSIYVFFLNNCSISLINDFDVDIFENHYYFFGEISYFDLGLNVIKNNYFINLHLATLFCASMPR